MAMDYVDILVLKVPCCASEKKSPFRNQGKNLGSAIMSLLNKVSKY